MAGMSGMEHKTTDGEARLKEETNEGRKETINKTTDPKVRDM